jgi:hypothetical protein
MLLDKHCGRTTATRGLRTERATTRLRPPAATAFHTLDQVWEMEDKDLLARRPRLVPVEASRGRQPSAHRLRRRPALEPLFIPP